MNGSWNWSTPLSAALVPLQRYSWSLAVTSGFAAPRRDRRQERRRDREVEQPRVVGEHLALAGARVDADQLSAGTGRRRRSTDRFGSQRLNVMPFRLSSVRTRAWRHRDDLLGAHGGRLARVEQRPDRDALDAALAGRADVQVLVADRERARPGREAAGRREGQAADRPRAAGTEHGPRLSSGGPPSSGTIPRRILPSRPISHSPPKIDSETTYSPLGSTSTSSAKPSGWPAKFDRARQLGLEAVPLGAVAVVVDDRGPDGRETAAVQDDQVPGARNALSVNGSLNPPAGAGSVATSRPVKRSSATTRAPAVRDADAGLGDEDVALVTRDAVGERIALGERARARRAPWPVLPAVRAAQRAPAP